MNVLKDELECIYVCNWNWMIIWWLLYEIGILELGIVIVWIGTEISKTWIECIVMYLMMV